MKTLKTLAIAALALVAQATVATPLTLSYQVTNLGSSYQYDFNLVLDNHDNSWAAGEQWDWLVFGDRVGGGSNAEAIKCVDWTWISLAAGSTSTCSSGAHQGNTLGLGGNGVILPGWSPTAVGQSLSWSGKTSTLVSPDNMYWSSLITGGGAQTVQFEKAKNTANLPEPASLLLFSLGLISLGLCRRLKS